MYSVPPYLIEQIKKAGHAEFSRQLARFYLKWFFIVTAIILVSLAILVLFVGIVNAQGAPCPAILWKGLIAEDVSGGYQGMYAVACCVRNRLNSGMNTGLCGLKRKNLDIFVKKQGVKYELMAKDIIRKVFSENAPDTTRGATHFESIRYPKPYWAYKMQVIIQVGEHIFYKRIK